MTLAAMMAGLHVSEVKMEDVRVVIFGSGTAGTGIADQIADTIATKTHKSKSDASKQIWYVLFYPSTKPSLAHPSVQVYRQTRPSPQIARGQTNLRPSAVCKRRFRVARKARTRSVLRRATRQTACSHRHIDETSSIHGEDRSRDGPTREAAHHIPAQQSNPSPRSQAKRSLRVDRGSCPRCDG